MKIPKQTYINIACKIDINNVINDSDREFLLREGFSDSEIKNKLEELIRDRIWMYVPENKIKIDFD